VFRELAGLVPHTSIVLLAALAKGCDQAFAEAGLRVLATHAGGVELVAVLPFARADCRIDFEGDPDAGAAFDDLLARAARVIELPAAPGVRTTASKLPDGRTVERVGIDLPSVRDEHYERVGRFLVVHAHAVVSMWDGRMAMRDDGRRWSAEPQR